ncbi:methyltransferase domain-containing protein [Mesorhizobium sp. M0011]|uniref:methyltransferase domain-containing protein n=1 Tax=Mesorhizobium sp. M0011 TaxID=2956839 RepID=UPI003339C312
MHSSDHHANNGPHSRKRVIALVLLAKLSLVAGFLVLAKLGMGYVQAGAWTAAFHGLVLAVIAGLALWGSLRHRGLVGNGAQSASDRGIGIVLHRAAAYDLLARVLTLGREGRFREFMLRPAKLQPGEAMLDVGCGTGTLAIAAKRLVGSDGSVTGVDASAEMIERARAKAERSGLDLTFVNGTAQKLPFKAGRPAVAHRFRQAGVQITQAPQAWSCRYAFGRLAVDRERIPGQRYRRGRHQEPEIHSRNDE